MTTHTSSSDTRRGTEATVPSVHERSERSFLARARTRLFAFDPGWASLRMGVTVLTIAVAIIGVEWLFVGQTHALQIDTHGAHLQPAQAAKVGFANHAAIAAAALTGVSAGLLSLIALVDPRPKQILITLTTLSALIMGGLAFGLGVDRHHQDIGLASIVVVLVVGCYLRRFGALGFASGIALFMGVFSGRQSSAHDNLGDIGWLAAELGLGLATGLFLLLVVFRPRPARALAGLQRGYVARTRRVLDLAVRAFESPTSWRWRRVQRAIVEMNETALMIDAQLVKPGAISESASARRHHERLFDIELATTNIVRETSDLADGGTPDYPRLALRATLHALSSGDLDRAAACAPGVLWDDAPDSAGRFVRAVDGLTDALAAWNEVDSDAESERKAFEPLPLMGSTVVSAAASQAPADPAFRGWDKVRLSASTRTTIQMAVAATAALFASRAVSTDRFYWAMIAVFTIFLGTSNTGEQAGKAIYRAAGTGVGIIVGSALGHAVGAGHWHASLVVLLAGLFWAFTFMNINYGIAVIGITVMASQIYVQLGEFSNSLLDMRLKETALGAGIAVLTVALVVPLRTRRVVSHSFSEYREALGGVTGYVSASLDGAAPEDDKTLTERVRRLDNAYQTLVVAAAPTHVKVYSARRFDPMVALAVATRTHSDSRRMIAALRDADRAPDETARAQLIELVRQDLDGIEQALHNADHDDETSPPLTETPAPTLSASINGGLTT